MVKIIQNVILLSIIIVYYSEISGFGDNLKKWIWKMFVYPLPMERIPDKPFFCSLCLTFWTGCIYLLIEGQFNFKTIGIVCLISYLTPITADLIRLLKDLFRKIIELLYKLFRL